MLHSIESALSEVFENAPVGTSIVPFPESPETDMEKLGAGFRSKRGRILLRESTAVTAAGGPQPQTDWKAQDLTPDLSKAPVCQPDPIHSPFGINYISGPQILDSQHAKINIRAARHTGYT